MEPFVIPTSLIGPSESVSSERVRVVVEELERLEEIEVQRSPTHRIRLNIPGYKRVREVIRSGGVT